jgi:predicted nucleotidyltransferase component of viral defense system
VVLVIDRSEIDQKAVELGVHTSDVQRDYIFGWLLAGIYTQSELGRHLVLKGGNCLRKAYFPFGRYSADLDFSTGGSIAPDYLATELNRVCGFVAINAGVEFDLSRTMARPKRSADDTIRILEARVYFRDFYGVESSMTISVRLDVTEMDRLYLPVQTRRLIHDYSDYESCSAEIRSVKLEEQLASKMKCLLQRRHVADLFDFVFATVIHPEFKVNRSEVVGVFFKKTIFGRSPGVAKGLFLDLPLVVFQGLWDRYIVCPIQARIDFSQVGTVFQDFIASLFGSIPVIHRQVEFFPAPLRNPIMQAGHTLTLLDVTYKGVRRRVEPYSLDYKVRRDGVGREYLYVYDRTGGSSGPGIKALVADGIQAIENTEETFEPRFPVEITKAGEISGSLYFEGRPGARTPFGGVRPMRTTTRCRTTPRSASRYIIQCSVCGKRFRRDKYVTRLNPHKDKYGNRCIGRIGYMV